MTYAEIAREAIVRGALQHPDELSGLLAEVHRHDPRTVVEIGVHTGGTLWAFRQILPEALLIAVDIDMHNLRNKEIASSVVIVEGDSGLHSTVREATVELDGRPIDFLFIDGDHHYDAAERDLELWSPMVSITGMIAFHDILGEFEPRGLKDLWAKIRRPHSVEIIRRDLTEFGSPLEGGIGIL